MIGGLQLFLNRNKQIQKICEYVKQHVKPVKTIKTTFCLFNLVIITNVTFIQNNGCPVFRWESKEHGLCEVDLSVSFLQNDNSTVNVTIPVANRTFQNCSVMTNSAAIYYKTIVYIINENGHRVEISEDDNKENFIYKALQTTTTTTTTTTQQRRRRRRRQFKKQLQVRF